MVSGHGGGLAPITSIGGSSGSFSSTSRLAHTPSSADFQPPYFPPPYNLPQQQIDFHHAHAVNAAAAAAAVDPYGHLNSLAGQQQYHHAQIHQSQARNAHVLQASRRDDAELQLHSNMHGGIHHGYADVTMSNSRRTANDMYSNMRRPDVLMHSGHHPISDQDLLNLHNSTIPLDDNQVRLITKTKTRANPSACSITNAVAFPKSICVHSSSTNLLRCQVVTFFFN